MSVKELTCLKHQVEDELEELDQMVDALRKLDAALTAATGEISLPSAVRQVNHVAATVRQTSQTLTKAKHALEQGKAVLGIAIAGIEGDKAAGAASVKVRASAIHRIQVIVISVHLFNLAADRPFQSDARV